MIKNEINTVVIFTDCAQKSKGFTMKNTVTNKILSEALESGKIYLYLRDEMKDPIWQVRIKLEGKGAAIRRSTGELKYDNALEKAYELMVYYKQRVENNLPIANKAFKEIALLFYQKMVRDWENGNRSEGNLRVKRVTIFKYLLPYFEKRDINEFKKIDIDKYKLWRKNYWITGPGKSERKKGVLNPASGTLAAEWAVFRNIVQLGIELDYINPKIMHLLKYDPFLRNRRPGFKQNEFEYLTSVMDEWAKSAPNDFMIRERIKTCNYVCILAYSGIRKGEARILKWKNIGYYENEHGSWITFNVSGKTGSRVVACQPGIEKYLEKIKSNSLHTNSDDYVFCHDYGTLIGHLPSVRSLLIYANLLYDDEGKVRTIYSFRHYYATLRLENGASIFWLTKNMGTSVKMLEHHYGHSHVLIGVEHQTTTRKNSQLSFDGKKSIK